MTMSMAEAAPELAAVDADRARLRLHLTFLGELAARVDRRR